MSVHNLTKPDYKLPNIYKAGNDACDAHACSGRVHRPLAGVVKMQGFQTCALITALIGQWILSRQIDRTHLKFVAEFLSSFLI